MALQQQRRRLHSRRLGPTSWAGPAQAPGWEARCKPHADVSQRAGRARAREASKAGSRPDQKFIQHIICSALPCLYRLWISSCSGSRVKGCERERA